MISEESQSVNDSFASPNHAIWSKSRSFENQGPSPQSKEHGARSSKSSSAFNSDEVMRNSMQSHNLADNPRLQMLDSNLVLRDAEPNFRLNKHFKSMNRC